jgi:Uma2 family endonuclease
MSVQLERRSFSAEEYHRLAEAGILSEDDRVELIEGEIFTVSPVGLAHIACVDRLNAILNRKVAQLAIVRVQSPIRLDNNSEPQPDISLLKPRDDFYLRSPATPSDVLLVIEVSDSSVDFDRMVKVPLYARAGIPEVWLAIVQQDHIEAYSRPVDGSYRVVRIVSRGESLSPESFPDVVVTVEEILG